MVRLVMPFVLIPFHPDFPVRELTSFSVTAAVLFIVEKVLLNIEQITSITCRMIETLISFPFRFSVLFSYFSDSEWFFSDYGNIFKVGLAP